MGKRTYGGYSTPTYMSKKRKITKRKYSRKGRKTNYINSNRGTATTSLYSTRRQPYSSYKRSVYNSLKFKESNRSVLSTFTTLTGTLTQIDKKIWYSATPAANFYESAGGYYGGGTFTASKLIIKGGMFSVVLRNDDTNPMTVEWGRLKWKNDDVTIAGVETEYTADVSNLEGFGQSFKLISKMKRVLIQPGETLEMRVKIPFTMINSIAQWNNENNGKTALVYSVAPFSASAMNVSVVSGHNLTFVADAIA